MPDVLILGARAPVALELARRFVAAGWGVNVADSIPCRGTAWSSAVSSFSRVASARFAPEAFIHDLEEIVRRRRIDLVLPTCEEVFTVSRYRDRLPAQVRVLAEEFGLLSALHSKWRFLELARSASVPVPDSAQVGSIGEAREWARGNPTVLKPEYSRFGVRLRRYPGGIPEDAVQLEGEDRWVAQRMLVGEEVCSYSIADRGRLLAHAAYVPRHRLRGSSSYYFDPCAPPTLEGHVRRLASASGFSGQISFDWILDAEGVAHVIECNPRATSGVHLFAGEEDLVAALCGDAVPHRSTADRSPRMIALLMLACGWRRASGRCNFSGWLEDFRRATDILTQPGDRLPLLGASMDLATLWRIAMRERIGLREASTHDLQWDGTP